VGVSSRMVAALDDTGVGFPLRSANDDVACLLDGAMVINPFVGLPSTVTRVGLQASPMLITPSPTFPSTSNSYISGARSTFPHSF
jgi:hypothetical protein